MILGISGSGRANSNSEHLLQLTLEVARAGGKKTLLVRLAELDFLGCSGCGACRRGADSCVMDDDLTRVLNQTRSASALVLGAPIYYGYPSGLFKSYLDRWYSFRDGARNLRVPTGRLAVLILTQGHADPDGYPWTVRSMDKVLTSYGCDSRILVAAGVSEAGDARARSDLEQRARSLGDALLSQAP